MEIGPNFLTISLSSMLYAVSKCDYFETHILVPSPASSTLHELNT